MTPQKHFEINWPLVNPPERKLAKLNLCIGSNLIILVRTGSNRFKTWSKWIEIFDKFTLTENKVGEDGLEVFWLEIPASQLGLADLVQEYIDLHHCLPVNLDVKASANRHSNYWWKKVIDKSKVEKILKGSLDLIPSPSPSVKIQIMGGKVCLRCKGKTLLGIVNKLLKTKSLLTSPSNVLEGDGIESRLSS